MIPIFLIVLQIMGMICFIRGGRLLWKRKSLADKEQAIGLWVTATLFASSTGILIAGVLGYDLR